MMTAFPAMTKLEKRVNLLAVALPFAGTLAAILLLWNSVVSATDLAILAVMYVLTGLGVTVGFHRMLTVPSRRPSRSSTPSPRLARWPCRAR
jgi:fatty-acid desaturase